MGAISLFLLTTPLLLEGATSIVSYQPNAVRTVKGTVTNIEKVEIPGNDIKLIDLTLQTNEGPITIRLGPENLVQEMNVKIDKGDAIEVTGSQMQSGSPMILPAEINKGGTLIHMRDKDTGDLAPLKN